MAIVRRVVTWAGGRRDAADVGLAVVLLVVALASDQYATPMDGYREANAGSALLVVLQVAPLAVRRRWPRVVLAVTFTALLVSLIAGFMPLVASFGPIIALYTVAAHVPRRPASRAAALCGSAFVSVMIAGMLRPDPPEDLTIGAIFSNVLVIVVASTLGDSVRSRRERIEALEERAALLERSQQELAERAVRDERSRIARELHDVVAHGMGVMVIQAGAARRVLHSQPEQAVQALSAIEAVGRESLGEMRRLLGVLRTDGVADVPREPQPGTGDLPDLVDRCRRAGLQVELVVEGDVRPLAPGVDLSAYRIVQEALSNVREHAGPANVCVRLCYADDVVEVQVLDDGRGTVREIGEISETGRGNGIVGMQERVELYGGKLCVGNRVGGGYAVRATLPLEESVT